MEITINGKKETHSETLTVKGLLYKMAIPSVRVAVEINKQILPKTDYEKYIVRPGDVIEVISFVGGG